MKYWHYKGLDAFTSKPIKVQISLDPNFPNPAYALLNPPERSIFSHLFINRWYLFTAFEQGHKAKLRQKGEAAHWHFINRFFGEGIKLHYRDCRRAFYDSLQQSLQLGATYDRPFHLHTPFVDKWKTEVVALGMELDVPYAQTHTCYEGKRPACGRCDVCTERINAFKANGIEDPLEYEIDISWSQ